MFKTFCLTLFFLATSAQAATQLKAFTPALASFATPYSANDVLGGVNTLNQAVDATKGVTTLGSISIVDKSKQKKSMDIFFFNSLPTISADNAAWDLTDAMASGKFIGVVSVADTRYVDSASNSMATLSGIGLPLGTVAGSTSLYAVCVTRDSPTYGSATDLVITLGLYEEK